MELVRDLYLWNEYRMVSSTQLKVTITFPKAGDHSHNVTSNPRTTLAETLSSHFVLPLFDVKTLCYNRNELGVRDCVYSAIRKGGTGQVAEGGTYGGKQNDVSIK